MQYAMELMRMSDDELVEEFVRQMFLRCKAESVSDKMMYNNHVGHIKNEIKRRMK